MSNIDEWKEFEEVFADIGKLMNPSWFSKDGGAFLPLYGHALQLCKFVEERELVLPGRIVFGMLDSMTIRAVARIRADAGYIGISVGAGLLLLHTFASVFCEKTMFPNIGHSNLERDYDRLPYVPSNAFNLDEGNSPIPICAIRMRAGVEMASLAFSFLVAHEVTHVQQGHLHLLATLGQIDSMEESAPNKEIAAPLVMQSLELLADLHGAMRILRRSFQIRKDSGYDSLPGTYNRRALREIYGKPIDAYYFVMFSIALTWRILDVQHWDEATLEQRSHPPVPARQLALMLNVAVQIKGNANYGVTAAEADLLTQRAFIDAHAAYLKITGTPNDERATAGLGKLAESEKSQSHLHALLMKLPETTERLKVHAWGWPGVQVARP